jgi:putative membrane protein
MKDSKMLDPDARFILANERTLLAWIRTSLTVIAGGIAFSHFSEKTMTTTVISLLVLFLGGAMTVIGYYRYLESDKAIRDGKLPDIGLGPIVIVAGVILFSAAIFTLEFIAS